MGVLITSLRWAEVAYNSMNVGRSGNPLILYVDWRIRTHSGREKAGHIAEAFCKSARQENGNHARVGHVPFSFCGRRVEESGREIAGAFFRTSRHARIQSFSAFRRSGSGARWGRAHFDTRPSETICRIEAYGRLCGSLG